MCVCLTIIPKEGMNFGLVTRGVRGRDGCACIAHVQSSHENRKWWHNNKKISYKRKILMYGNWVALFSRICDSKAKLHFTLKSPNTW